MLEAIPRTGGLALLRLHIRQVRSLDSAISIRAAEGRITIGQDVLFPGNRLLDEDATARQAHELLEYLGRDALRTIRDGSGGRQRRQVGVMYECDSRRTEQGYDLRDVGGDDLVLGVYERIVGEHEVEAATRHA